MKTIEEMKWKVKTYNALKRSGINSVDDVLKMTYVDITSIKNISRKSVEEIEDSLNIKFR